MEEQTPSKLKLEKKVSPSNLRHELGHYLAYKYEWKKNSVKSLQEIVYLWQYDQKMNSKKNSAEGHWSTLQNHPKKWNCESQACEQIEQLS